MCLLSNMAARHGKPLSGIKRKKGTTIVLWSLGTVWVAVLMARSVEGGDLPLKCEDLRVGQYICDDPKIDNDTQEPENCTNHTAYVACHPAPNITCKDFSGNETQFTGKRVGFYRPIECRNVNGYSYKVAVALSLFLGWLGADRFYLGYPALGLLKFCTVGFCGIGSLIDFILISMQIVGPSDGSSYIIDYYGARLTRLSITNETFRKPQIYP
ncbi:PREDICTED: TM2 domain-containing protein 1 [Gekko japonicus]|uniref:TM2 domain-containing protein 1 n=1 Tax=Gekko japonicus TaxID=146911 RepID=A0ABM1KAH1_GEKJA|nr:PREDICTED: TM2 domain-containing protein 1 [Gekko japonicus]XP_015270709.1 PREDICTED: TM2 domain-containing protein 1 [Gekko japonicus]XP_015270710.1 PREDICTED: TM2 domain-containing protein 1 [Gekko japonicus]